MEISQPKHKEPTPEELKELEKLKAIIERATAEGRLTGEDFENIKAAILADKKVSYEELRLLQALIYDKIDRGELEKVWD